MASKTTKPRASGGRRRTQPYAKRRASSLTPTLTPVMAALEAVKRMDSTSLAGYISGVLSSSSSTLQSFERMFQFLANSVCPQFTHEAARDLMGDLRELNSVTANAMADIVQRTLNRIVLAHPKYTRELGLPSQVLRAIHTTIKTPCEMTQLARELEDTIKSAGFSRCDPVLPERELEVFGDTLKARAHLVPAQALEDLHEELLVTADCEIRQQMASELAKCQDQNKRFFPNEVFGANLSYEEVVSKYECLLERARGLSGDSCFF